MHNLDALIRRLSTAASRGYGVGAAAKYSKMLGGDGSETTAKELLDLALKAKAGGLPKPAPEKVVVEEYVEVSPPVPEEEPEEEPLKDETPSSVVEDDEIDEDPEDDEGAEPDPKEEEEEEELPSKKDLKDMTKEELYDVAQEVDLPGRSDMNKPELLKALRKHLG